MSEEFQIVLDERVNVPNLCPHLSDLKSYMTFENPDFDSNSKYKNNQPPFLSFFREEISTGKFRFPIGVKDYLLSNFCNNCPHKCSIVDNRSVGCSIVENVQRNDSVVLRRGQISAVKAVVDHFKPSGNGLIVMPTGSGKTLTGLEVSRMAQINTLFVVPRVDLAHQTMINYEKFYGRKAGYIGEGKYNLQPLTVAIFDSLSRKERYEEWSEYFGMSIWDEVHSLAAPKRYKSFVSINTKFKLGISATLHKKNGLGVAINRMFGGVIFQLPISEAIRDGDIVPLHVEYACSNYFTDLTQRPYGSASTYFNAILNDLESDEPRNSFIAKEIARCVYEGSKVVVILNSRTQALQINHMLKSFQRVKQIVYMGDLSSKDRQVAKLQVENGELNVLLTVKLAGLGLDIPHLDTIIMDQKISDPLSIEQYVGRVVRACPEIGKKMARVIHIRDTRIKMFENQYNAALEVYKKFSLPMPQNVLI